MAAIVHFDSIIFSNDTSPPPTKRGDRLVSSSDSLARNSTGLLGLVVISLAGVLAIIGPMEVAAFIGVSGPAAIWPVIIGFVLFLLVSLPILEYTKITSFAGGYYGLAELGFGKAVGKYTALSNFFFYNFWQMTNAFGMSAILLDSIYLVLHMLIPIWLWLLLAIGVLVVTNLISILPTKRLAIILTAITIVTLAIVVIFTLFVIAKSPFNSVYYLNPANSYSGFTGIATGTAIYGFFLYVGYGTTLFFSEEGRNAKRNVWRAIYLGLGISAVVIALSAYSEVVSVPLSSLSSVSSATLPQLVTWNHYIPSTVLLGFNILVFVISIMSFGAGGGSQSRLLWSMSRDSFIKSKWLRRLSSKNNVPVNAVIAQFVLALATVLVVAVAMIGFYGYSPTTVTVAWFAAGTAGTIIWYFHHFIPEFGLYPFLRKHPNLKYPAFRKYVAGLIVPIGGTALFIYTFYVGIVADLVEPYFAFVIVDTIILIVIAFFVAYKGHRGEIGDSTVSYMAAEAGGTVIGGSDNSE